jgi:hypothetical protein
VVAFDHFRAAHTPAVAAAVWAAVTHGDLNPICVTPHKLYGSWSDPTGTQEALAAWVTAEGGRTSRHEVSGKPFLYAADWTGPLRSEAAAAAVAPPQQRRRGAAARRLAADVLPPVLTRAIRRARRSYR